MLALLLFNSGGYALLFQYFIYRSDNSVNERINNNQYKNADLFEVKIPVHLNIQDWTEYGLVSGQVQFRDNSYNYAELKMTRDTIYLMCIPNPEKARLVNANIIYAKFVNDIPMSKKAHAPSVKKSTGENEYNYTLTQYHPKLTGEAAKPLSRHTFPNIIKPFIGIPGQPPEDSSKLS